jgi:hypothetical protein
MFCDSKLKTFDKVFNYNKNMKTREILSIVALAALGLCLLCGLAKMAMKNPKAKQSCDHACSLLVFVAVVLVGVSQLIEEEGYKELNLPYWEPGVGALPWTFSGEGKMKKKMSMGLGDSGNGTCAAHMEPPLDKAQPVGCCTDDVTGVSNGTGCCTDSNCNQGERCVGTGPACNAPPPAPGTPCPTAPSGASSDSGCCYDGETCGPGMRCTKGCCDYTLYPRPDGEDCPTP